MSLGKKGAILSVHITVFTADGPRMKRASHGLPPSSRSWPSYACGPFFSLRRNPSSRDNLKPIKDPYSVPAFSADGSFVYFVNRTEALRLDYCFFF